MKYPRKLFFLILMSVLVFLGIIVINFLVSSSYFILGSYFSKVPIKIADYNLNDLGIVDLNQDQNLDIFTTNHSAQQSILIGNGNGNFTDEIATLGFSQDRAFPRLENSATAPTITNPGFYIYRQDGLLHLVAYKADALGQLEGTLQLSSDIKFQKQDNVDVSVNEEVLDSGGTISKLDFSLKPDGHLAIESFVEIPHRFSLSDSVSLDSLHLGTDALHPTAHRFELMWRDRHSMAWTDFNQDDQLDVFVGRGGIKGKMHELPETFADELFISQGNDFSDQVHLAGMVKDNCPGRQSAWIDYDQDGLLDLYNACGRGSYDTATYPHQLFHQEVEGTFKNLAGELGIDLPRNGTFLWVDLDQDGDPDLIATQGKELLTYINHKTRFQAESLGQLFDDSTKKFTVTDYDLDGNLDIYISGTTQNYLLVKSEKTYTLTDPKTVGLPGQGLCANWVDYDNDGLVDLHAVPGGLYRQQANHRFKSTRLLSESSEIQGISSSRLSGWTKSKLQKVRCAWPDYNNDGYRDLIISEEKIPSLQERFIGKLTELSNEAQWQTHLLKNEKSDAHWLEIDLKSSNDNRQAIGASVAVSHADINQVQQVGSAESSYFSQGHYRLYFGLGTNKKVSSIKITWPNGQVQTIRDVSIDQLITIDQA